MSLWMPLKKEKNKENTPFEGGVELSPETLWKLYTLAEGLSPVSSTQRFAPPGVFIGRTEHGLSREISPPEGTLLLPKLDFTFYPYLLFIVDNEFTVTVENDNKKGAVTFPFLSYFDKDKLTCCTHVNGGIFTSKNITLTPSLLRKRFPCNFIDHYS